MKLLINILILKIVATVGTWSLPLILMPAAALNFIGLTPPDNTLFLRLLGWAYVALCTGYYAGLVQARRGLIDRGVMTMAVVSNGGACLMMLAYALFGDLSALTPAGLFIGASSMLMAGFFAVSLYVLGFVRPPQTA